MLTGTIKLIKILKKAAKRFGSVRKSPYLYIRLKIRYKK